MWIYFYRSDGAPGSDRSLDASSRVGPGYTRGKDCAGLALTPSNYSNTLKAHCGFISIDLMARQTPTSSKNVCCGSQHSIDNSTFCDYFLHVSGAHLQCQDACADPARRPQKGRPEGSESHRSIGFYAVSQRALGAGHPKAPRDAISPSGPVSTLRHEGSDGVRTP